MNWRAKARAVIRQVMADHPKADPKELRRLISEAYPFGERKYHPYKIWLDEVSRQLGDPTLDELGLTVRQAQELCNKVSEAFMFANFDIDPTRAERLWKLADYLDKVPASSGQILLGNKESKFPRQLEKKLNAQDSAD
jgi:isocitrate dehydrogenase kinase/phosphatase